MNPIQEDSSMLVANILMWLVLVISFMLWVRILRSKQFRLRGNPPPAMDWGWTEFALLLWGWMVANFMTSAIMLHVFGDGNAGDREWITLIHALGTQLALAATVLVARYLKPFSLFAGETMHWSKAVVTGAVVLLVFLPGIWVVNGISLWFLTLLGYEPKPQDAVSMLIGLEGSAKWMLAAVTAGLIAPVIEEIFFRGILFRYLAGRFPLELALLVSALLFALVHFHVESFIPLAVLGYLLAWSYWKTGDLRVPIIMHALFNLMSVFLIHIERMSLGL